MQEAVSSEVPKSDTDSTGGVQMWKGMQRMRVLEEKDQGTIVRRSGND